MEISSEMSDGYQAAAVVSHPTFFLCSLLTVGGAGGLPDPPGGSELHQPSQGEQCCVFTAYSFHPYQRDDGVLCAVSRGRKNLMRFK